MKNYVKLLEFAKKHTAPVSQQVVEAFPGATYARARFVIDYIEVSGSAAGDLQLLDDNNAAIDGYYFAFGVGVPVKITFPLKKITLGRGFRYTTTGGGNHNVLIKYHLEQENPL